MVDANSADNDIKVTAFNNSQQKTFTVVLINTGSSSKTFSMNFQGANIPGTFTAYRTTATENFVNAGSYTKNSNITLPASSVVTLYGSYTGTDAGIAPAITAHPANTTVAIGATAVFDVDAVGTPGLSFQWYKNGTAIPDETGRQLRLKNITSSDNGATVYCRVSNAYGSVNSSTATITVQAFSGVNINKVTAAPVIDGTAESVWNTAQSISLSKKVIGNPSNNDVSATAKVMWDNSNLYLYIDITDDNKVNDGADNADSFELFLDADNSKNQSYGANDYQFLFKYGSTTVTEWKHNATSGVVYNYVNRTGGYTAEVKIPLATVGITPTVSALIGIDIAVDDNDGTGRESKIAYNTTSNDIWFNPSYMGTGRLVEAVARKGVEQAGSESIIYPNPGTGIFYVKSGLGEHKIIEIVDAFGKMISCSATASQDTYVLDLTNQPNGLYFLKINTKGVQTVHKLVKQ